MAAHFRGVYRVLKPVKWYTSLHTPRGRSEAGVFLIEGYRAVAQVAGTCPHAIEEVLAGAEADLGELSAYPCRRLTSSQIERIAASKTPQGIIAVVKTPADLRAETLPSRPGDRILVLEDIQDPGNVGTLIRTAAALGFDGVLASGKSADPLGAKAVQSAAGSLFSLWLRRTDRYLLMIDRLKRQGFQIAATAAGGISCRSWEPKTPLVIALGNEGNGLSEALMTMADRVISVPQLTDRVESLNVSVAGAICMFFAAGVGNGE